MLVSLKKKTLKRENIFIFGSTGSIGTSTLKILEDNDTHYKIFGLSCHSNYELLMAQIIKFKPKFVAITSEFYGEKLVKNLPNYINTQVFIGKDANNQLIQYINEDALVVAAIAGISGLASTLESAKKGAKILLANKESVVSGYELLKNALSNNQTSEIIPIDSEHSALFQLMLSEKRESINKIILTASGGSFRKLSLTELENVTLKDALKHPNWDMGAKVTIDSATMVNKALEVIEAHYLFGFNTKLIEIIIHPSSIVHGMIDLIDGTQLMHASYPDMRVPIAFGLSYFNRRYSNLIKAIDLTKVKKLEFFALDNQRFPAVSLAKQAIDSGAKKTAVFNAANEVAVNAFMKENIKFNCIVPFIEFSLEKLDFNEELSLATLAQLQNEVVVLLDKFKMKKL